MTTPSSAADSALGYMPTAANPLMMTNQVTASAPDGAYEGPDRWLLDNDVEDDPSWYDELGFLVPSRVPGRRHLREALGLRVVMIVGEPWAGKTFVSRHLEAAAVRCGGRAFLLSLEERRQNYSPRWVGDGDLTRGCAWCVIDAADEGVYSGISVVEVLETVRAAEPVTSALRVVVLSRNDASLSDVHANVERVFGPCPVMRLLPMDRREARRGLTKESWQRLCAHLTNPLLRQFARYHVATTFLAGREGDVGPADVWRGMLEELCEERRIRGGPPLQTTASARVRAAERFAAVSLLARHRSIDLDRPSGRLLPHDLFPRNDDQLRVAARELRYTSLLKRSADGEYRFRYRFAEEILAALATSDVTPESLRSLVTGPDGKLRDDLAQYAATFVDLNGPERPVLLADGNRVSRFSRDEVRYWVDRLVAAAGRVTPWIKGQDLLRWLNVGGLEDDLASRVINRRLANGGRQVLFDIAHVNRIAGSFADNALTIALSNDEDIELRERAVYYLSDLGSPEHIQALTAISSAAPSSSSALRARALRVLLERGLERPLRVASLAERPDPHHYDARAALVSAIEAALTHEDALLLVQSWTDEVRAADLPSIDELILEKLRDAAVNFLASRRDSEAADVDALVSLFLDDERIANHCSVSADIDDAFRNKRELRRAAFASLEERLYRVDRFISQDDLSWLIEDGTTTGARKYVATIYRLRASGVLGPGAISEATAFLEARADVLAELDRDWAEAEASRQEWLRRHPPRKPQTRRALRDVLRTVLESDMPPSNRLRALGAYCFATEGWARSDIDGSFDELQEDERAAVIAAMVDALPESSPTPIPDAGSSYPTAILYEAAAVAALVLRRHDVRADATTVERWLPTLLFDLREEIAAAVSYLIEDHRELAEVAAAGAIRRELRAQSEHVHIAYALPPELWTPRFVRAVTAMVRDASYT